MTRGRCPICSRQFEFETLDDHPSFPFCSDRCKLIDLGRWIDGAYTLPGAPESQDEESLPEESDESKEE